MSVGNPRVRTDWLRLDAGEEAEAIIAFLRHSLSGQLRRRGLVVGVSGGIDSAVTAALAVRAVGPERVFGLLMPERESTPETLELSRMLVGHLGIPHAVEDVTPLLQASGFYQRYRQAVQQVIPAYGPGWGSKLVAHAGGSHGGFTFFSLVAAAPGGARQEVHLPVEVYLEIVAATNFKQRCRKMLEYHHADRLNFAVAGTPNLLEYDQGFFVKNGDGAADIKPIAHLYKTQVYQVAEHLGIPEAIRSRPPTTDTYSLAQGQDEFYFALPYSQMDLCLFGLNHGIPVRAVAEAAGLSTEQVETAWRNIRQKRNTIRYLHLPPLVMTGRVQGSGMAAALQPPETHG